MGDLDRESGSKGSGRERSRSGVESEDKVERNGKMSKYEKLRLSRIAENTARLEGLCIFKGAKALMGSRKRRVKGNSGEEDDDYRPGEADGDEEESDSECDDEDEEFPGGSICVSRKRKNKSSTSKRKVLSKKNLNRSDPLGEDDELKKAIALSLHDSVAGGSGTAPSKKMRNDEETRNSKKKKTELMSKMQMTEDELVIYFYQFDEAGKGFITLRDVAKMATVHDFAWTEEELQDMIIYFDIDKDGKLSLGELRKIVMRCRMLKES